MVLSCLGDEPYKEVTRPYVEGCDWLLSEAFCLDRDKEIFHPYEKHHSTALDAGSWRRNCMYPILCCTIRRIPVWKKERKPTAGKPPFHSMARFMYRWIWKESGYEEVKTLI